MQQRRRLLRQRQFGQKEPRTFVAVHKSIVRLFMEELLDLFDSLRLLKRDRSPAKMNRATAEAAARLKLANKAVRNPKSWDLLAISAVPANENFLSEHRVRLFRQVFYIGDPCRRPVEDWHQIHFSQLGDWLRWVPGNPDDDLPICCKGNERHDISISE